MSKRKPSPGDEGDSVVSKKVKRQNQLWYWCITVNNTDLDMENFFGRRGDVETGLMTFASKYIFNLEKGEQTGRLHWQIWIKTNKRRRKDELAKEVCTLFRDTIYKQPNMSVKLEPSRSKAAEKYCGKLATRVAGPFTNTNIYLGCDLPGLADLYMWQKDILEILSHPSDDRSIHWVWEPDGNVGKTKLLKYIIYNNPNEAILVGGKKADCLYSVKPHHKIVLMNIPRTYEDYVSYDAIESIKDGLFYSSKYESEMVVMNPPHVLVMANFYPDVKKMSLDRWKIGRIHFNDVGKLCIQWE